ncbi:MAG: alpha/beta hydrolase [Candidatus Pseudomonas phytovorans]|uniref:Alpha/beta hydrolase n=1 Tax=Candidatus Pseudomonas phytovorans TaxID=3121377 RepID=A0AAJ6BDF1_9PSED|nr:alpha/beta hydrolase [Pseudomonas sp.]WEK32943.1 MAG: alpha/beta hydrolase [Pseudomonas sp.]
MTLQKRSNVHIAGSGNATLILSHGFGCDQSMWKLLLPHFAKQIRVITYDLVGAGQSALAAYDREKYSSLWGYAADLNEIIDEFGQGPVIIAGHSVSAMIGVLAERQRPGRITGLVMIGGSPCYVDSSTYTGGFSRDEVLTLLSVIDENYLGWSSTMAPVLMGSSGEPALQGELLSSLCRTDAQIARHFARVIFLSDHRQDVVGLRLPTLILQCTEDPVVPVAVGEYLHSVLPNSRLVLVDNMGHYPQLSAPSACSAAIDGFLASLRLGHEGSDLAVH